jgi:hypothetical protein
MAVEDFWLLHPALPRDSPGPISTGPREPSSLLARAFRSSTVYLQSVPAALADQNVAARWSKDVRSSTGDAGLVPPSTWQAEVARLAYRWLSDKTQPATRLFWWNDLVMPLVGMGKQSRQDLPRLKLPPEIRQAAMENYEGWPGARPRYTYYYRTRAR